MSTPTVVIASEDTEMDDFIRHYYLPEDDMSAQEPQGNHHDNQPSLNNRSSDSSLPRGHLMALPTEIRLRILEHLLWQPNPVECYQNVQFPGKDASNWLLSGRRENTNLSRCWKWDRWANCDLRSYVSAVSVSRRLRDEAMSVFYRINTFSITVFSGTNSRELNGKPCIDLLGIGTPSKVMWKIPHIQRCTKFEIKVYLRKAAGYSQWFTANRTDLGTVSDDLNLFLPHTSEIDIYLYAEDPGDKLTLIKNDLQAKAILYSFGLLRCRKVQFHNTSAAVASKLSSIIEGTSPAVDLEKEFEALEKYLGENGWVRGGRLSDDPSARVYDDLREVMWNHDITKFMALRNSLVHMLISFMTARLEQAWLDGREIQTKWLPVVKNDCEGQTSTHNSP